jgi:hypothetical protein
VGERIVNEQDCWSVRCVLHAVQSVYCAADDGLELAKFFSVI